MRLPALLALALLLAAPPLAAQGAAPAEAEAVLDALDARNLAVFLVASSLKGRSLDAAEAAAHPESLVVAARAALRESGDAALLREAAHALDAERYARFLARDAALLGLDTLDPAFERFLAPDLSAEDEARYALAARYAEASGRLDFMVAVARPGVEGVASTADAQAAIALRGFGEAEAVGYAMETVRVQLAEVLPALYAHLHAAEPLAEIEALVAFYEAPGGGHAAALVTGAFASRLVRDAGEALRRVGVASVTGPPEGAPPPPAPPR